MKRKIKYLFLLSVIYFTLFVFKKFGFYFPIVSDYFSDLICIPVSLLFIEWFSSKISNKKLEIGNGHILVAILYFTIVFEFWMPSISKQYTSDNWDILCYFIGGGIYWLLFRKSKFLFQTV